MVTGRPTVMTDEVVRKLEEGFCAGLTDEQACLYADISKPTLYDYCNKYPEFSNRKEILKEQPLIRAKLNVTKNINSGDLTDSKWYLERKGKKEFSLRTENDLNIGNKDNKPFELSNLSVEQIKELLKQESNNTNGVE
jgi:hypothetical protein